MRLRCWLGWACALALVGCDCGKGQPETAAVPEAPASASSGAQTGDVDSGTAAPGAEGAASSPAGSGSAGPVAAAFDAPVEVKLIDPGAEPRKPLRYKFHIGSIETLRMDMRMAMGMQVGMNKQPEGATPGMRMVVVLTPTETTPAGDVRCGFRLQSAEVLKDPTIAPQVLAAAEAHLATLTGLTGSAVIDARGMTKAATFEPPANMGSALRSVFDNLRHSLRNVASPLPEEPVGKGARWEVTLPLDTPGLKLRQVTTHKLESIVGDKVRVQVSLKQEAPRQPVTIPGAPPDSTAVLEELESTGSGKMSYDLNRIVPDSTLTMTSASTISAKERGTAQTIKMTVRMQVETKRQ